MLEVLLGVLVWVLVGGLIYWAIHRLAAAFGIPSQIVAVLDVVIVIVVVLALLRLFGLVPEW